MENKICPNCGSIVEGQCPDNPYYVVYICDNCGFDFAEFDMKSK